MSFAGWGTVWPLRMIRLTIVQWESKPECWLRKHIVSGNPSVYYKTLDSRMVINDTLYILELITNTS